MERDKNNKITNESIKSWIFNNTKEFTEILTKSNFEINGVDDDIKKLLDWSNCRNGLPYLFRPRRRIETANI
jgi:hypothetical protein